MDKLNDDLNRENRDMWDTNAAVWDEAQGEAGNDWHNKLIAPQTIDLLNLEPGQHLLDIGCGNGVFARKMASQGMMVTAFDFSANNIQQAKAYPHAGISYKVLDATQGDQLASLGQQQFDAAVANMVLMDVPELDPLFRALAALLKPNGVFVFSVCHPCFNAEGNMDFGEDSINIHTYTHSTISKGKAVSKQPVMQYYFHRSIETLLSAGLEQGFVLDAIKEPVFEKNKHKIFSELPPVLIARLRLLKASRL